MAVAKPSAVKVKTLPPGTHGDGGGLYLAVSPAGARSWVFRYRDAGRLREMGLGSARDVPLADARRKAADLRRMRADGIDPLAAKRATEVQRRADVARRAVPCRAVPCRAVPCRQVVETYIEANRPGWRNAKHAAQWAATLENRGGSVCLNSDQGLDKWMSCRVQAAAGRGSLSK